MKIMLASWGDKIEEYREMDKTDSLGMEKSLRIRVCLDVRKLLKKMLQLKFVGGGGENL